MEENRDFIVNDIINDLDAKINSLNSLISKADENNKTEVKNIVAKTTTVLRDAAKLLANTSEEISSEDLQTNADYIKEKSNSLYEDAINRIRLLINDKTIIFSKKENNVSFENVSNDDNLSQQSISILRTWLMPEDAKK